MGHHQFTTRTHYRASFYHTNGAHWAFVYTNALQLGQLVDAGPLRSVFETTVLQKLRRQFGVDGYLESGG